MGFSLNYDDSKLTFDRVQEFDLVELNASNFANPTSGVVTASWQESALSGVSVADGTVIAEVCFDIIGGGTSTVDVTDSPLAREAIDSNTDLVAFVSNNGTVTATGTGGGSDDLTFTVADADADVGDIVCLPVSVDNFRRIFGFQFSIRYDQQRLRFDGVQDFQLSELSTGNFEGMNAGFVNLSWVNSIEDDGVTLPDGTEIFEVCFEVLGGTSVVEISGDPLDIEAIDADINEIPVQTVSGTINADDTGSQDLTLTLEDISTQPGEEVCMDFTVDNFSNIVGAQFTISYVADDLTFTEIVEGGPLNLTVNENFSILSPGTITFLWEDKTSLGVTLPDNSVLFEVCFEVNTTTSTEVTLSETPTAIEFLDVVTIEGVPLQINSGTISIGSGQPFSVDASITAPSCNGDSDGSITLNVSGGQQPYSYEWPGSVSGNPGRTANNLEAGSYTVTITDNGGAQLTETVNVENPPVINASVVASDISCNGALDGMLELNASGGTGTLSFNWNGNLPDDQTTITELGPGTYTVTVTDANGCSVDRAATIAQPTPITASGSVVNITQLEPGSITTNVSGGTAPYTFTWSGPDGFQATTKDINGLTETGEYILLITDDNGCSRQRPFIMGDNLRIAGSTVTQTCFMQETGSIDIDPSGSTGNYTFSWVDGDGNVVGTTEDLENLPAGTYTVTIRDGDLEVSEDYTIQELNEIAVDPSIQNATDGENGQISLSVSGGEPPYTYQWDNEATTRDISQLAPGAYCVTITDNALCTYEECFSVASSNLQLEMTIINSPSCQGKADGSASITISGGAAPFTVSVPQANFQTQVNTASVTIDGLLPGSYEATITDNQGASQMVGFTINASSAVIVEPMVVNDTEDLGCTGSITLNLQGGTAPYTVNWNVPAVGQQISNLCAGTYIPTIRDANGCEFSGEPITLSELQQGATITPPTCDGDENGSIRLVTEFPQAELSFIWRREGSPDTIGRTGVLENIGAGVYISTTVESTGARLIRRHVVAPQSSFQSDARTVSDYNGFGVSCASASDGVLEAVITGQGSFSYEWVIDGRMAGVDRTLINASPGEYNLFVIDEFGCERASIVELTAPPALVVTPSVSSISCRGDSDGEILVDVAGGVFSRPYAYSWSDGETGPRRRFLPVGNYTLTVTDANGCQVVESYEVGRPDPIQVSLSSEPDQDPVRGSGTGVVRAEVTGGNPPYNYDWTNLPNAGNTPEVANLDPGDYMLLVTDSRGCAFEDGELVATVQDRSSPCFTERNVITPDGNGSNDEFVVFCLDEFIDNNLEIYNRWGQLVFSTRNYQNDWEGISNDGDPLPAGPYYFVLTYEDNSNVMQEVRGSITIVRNR